MTGMWNFFNGFKHLDRLDNFNSVTFSYLDNMTQSPISRRFLLDRFNRIKANNLLIPSDWPSADSIIDWLVQKSGGQFIYVSTHCTAKSSPMFRTGLLPLFPVFGCWTAQSRISGPYTWFEWGRHLRLLVWTPLVLDTPLPRPDGSEIKIPHLINKLRSGNYYLNAQAFHTNLAKQGARQICVLSTMVKIVEDYPASSNTWYPVLYITVLVLESRKLSDAS